MYIEKLSLNNKVIIVGLFSNPKTAPVTQASVLASLLSKNGYTVITTSGFINKWLRFVDIIRSMLLNAGRYNVAIVQFYSGNSFIWQYIAAFITKLLGKDLVFTVHGGGVPAKLKSKSSSRYLKLLKKADLITVPSQYLQNELVEFGLKTILIENIIDLKQYPFQDKKAIGPRLLWMRAFSDIYNPLMAVRVVNALRNKYPEVKMIMGGPDLGMLSATKQLIHELTLGNNIELIGFMDMEMKQQYASVCDIYISTNKIDNAPVTFLEMWAMGLPVVSTNVGGIPYLIENKQTGIIVNDDDYNQMAEAIESLIENKENTLAIIKNARIKAALYDEIPVLQKWEAALNTIST